MTQEVEHWMGSGGLACRPQTNSEFLRLLAGSQTVGAKLHGQKEKNPDRRLRSLNFS